MQNFKNFHILQELEEDKDSENTEDNNMQDQVYHTAPNTPEKEINSDNTVDKPAQAMQIPKNAAEGTPGPNTFSLIIEIAGRKATSLFDSGSSDTFIST